MLANECFTKVVIVIFQNASHQKLTFAKLYISSHIFAICSPENIFDSKNYLVQKCLTFKNKNITIMDGLSKLKILILIIQHSSGALFDLTFLNETIIFKMIVSSSQLFKIVRYYVCNLFYEVTNAIFTFTLFAYSFFTDSLGFFRVIADRERIGIKIRNVLLS